MTEKIEPPSALRDVPSITTSGTGPLSEFEIMFCAHTEALERLGRAERENARLREALKFYASEGMWLDDIAPDPAGTPVPYSAPMWSDLGEKARAALAETEGK